MESDWVVNLDPSCQCTIDDVGFKAYNLIRLQKFGLNVPKGFCVTTKAYLNHLQEQNLFSFIKSNLRNPFSVEEESLILEEIRGRIIRAKIEPAFEEELKNNYSKFAGVPLAVRSSATAEDMPKYSFAGQYETFLGITDFPSCLEAIKRCWASLWSKQAFCYRQANSLGHLNIAVAVIVQSLVKAESSGVSFSINPVNGRKEQIIIESCFGLGEGLVSGKITPDRYIFNKQKLQLVSRNASKKEIQYILNGKDGLVEKPLESHKINEFSLKEGLAREIAAAAKEIERKFGGPQDIEWAVQNGEIFFLQSRPITTIFKEKSWEDRQVWINMNTAEIVPDVLTPITWSLFRRMVGPLFRSVWRLLGADPGDNPVFGLVVGRVYFNLNTIAASIQHLPKFAQKGIAIEDLLGGKMSEEFKSGRLRFQKEDLPDLKGSVLKILLRIPETVYKLYKYRPARSRKLLNQLKYYNDCHQALDFPRMSESELIRNIADYVEQIKNLDLLGMRHLFVYPVLRWMCKRWLNDQNGQLLHKLIRGTEGIEIVEAGFDLWNLAAEANRKEDVKQLLLSSKDWNSCSLQLDKSENGRHFLQKWNSFLTVHGHHCRGELELFNRRWSEDPDYVLSLVRNFLTGGLNTNPKQMHQKLEKERVLLLQDCLSKLRNPVKKYLFRKNLKKVQTGIFLRENWKNQVVRLDACLRKILIELGKRLCNRGMLKEADDIFFLELGEIFQIGKSSIDSELPAKIQPRRDEYLRNLTTTPPHIVFGKFYVDAAFSEEMGSRITVLQGLSVCPGKVAGKAKVILRADSAQQVLPGEILVAPFTDPGWSPYFLTAAGIVMDQGGLLSHGSIIAREYGIPAVVNVGPATKIIKTGQNIMLDADTGKVTILSDGASG
jgi:pyruvate,water dikinase